MAEALGVASEGSPLATRTILDVDIRVAGRAEALAFLTDRLRHRSKTLVAFANTNFLNACRWAGISREVSTSFVVFNDGVGLNLASWLTYGSAFPDNLNGTDLTRALLEASPPETRVFLFGARPGVAALAAEVIVQRYGVRVCGIRDGYTAMHDPGALVAAVNAAAPDILLVGLGNPHQELWILAHSHEVEAPLIVAVGAFLDFTANRIPRAPRWMRAVHLEWLYRLLREPRRLWRRYTVEIAMFFYAVASSGRAARARRNAPKDRDALRARDES